MPVDEPSLTQNDARPSKSDFGCLRKHWQQKTPGLLSATSRTQGVPQPPTHSIVGLVFRNEALGITIRAVDNEIQGVQGEIEELAL
jgi:hypothetical protein